MFLDELARQNHVTFTRNKIKEYEKANFVHQSSTQRI
jgi:hypothetical protein